MSTRPHARRRRIPRRAIVIAAVALAAAALWWWSQRKAAADDRAYRTTTVERGDIRVTISATGTLTALSTVDVGSQISGQVTEVLVDFNDPVRQDTGAGAD